MRQVARAKLIERIYRDQYCANQRIPGPFGERLVTYADYVASGQPLRFIEDYLHRVVLPTYANTHTEASFTGRQTGHYRQEARRIIRHSVNAGAADALIFCGSGCTAAIDKVVRLVQHDARQRLGRPLVFLGPYEHHSNVLPWREGGFDVITVPVDEDGLVDLLFLESQLRHYQYTRPLIGSFSAASNVTGILAPVDAITALLHRYGALSFWDYAAGAPYLPIDMNPGGLANKDALFISAHKLMGGPGTPGVLVVKKHLVNPAVPTVPAGGTVHFVTKTQQRYYDDIEVREEGGTPAIIESIRAGLAFKLKDTVGTEYIGQREADYSTRSLAAFKQHPAIYVLGNTDVPRLGILAFHIRCAGRFLHHNFVVALLNDLFGIQARGGCSCAGPYGHDLLSLSEAKSKAYMAELATGNVGSKPGWVRLSVNYFIPEAEFRFLIDAVRWVADHGWKLLKAYHFDDRNALWQVRNNPAPVDSLDWFLWSDFIQPPKDVPNRATECRTYLQEADGIARRALAEWSDTPVQSYHYGQVTNPLRWYTLADDIDVATRPGVASRPCDTAAV